MITLDLPWCPSNNKYFRNVRGGKTLLSRQGREYQVSVMAAMIEQGMPTIGDERCRVTIEMIPPDRRRRDVDNFLKAPLDALQKSGFMEDDTQVDDLRIWRPSDVPLTEVLIRLGI